MDNALIEQIINEVIKKLDVSQGKEIKEIKETKEVKEVCLKEQLSKKDYPLIKNRKELLNTKTGKTIDEININNVINGNITPEDIKITGEVLLYQAQIAESVGRYQFARNLKRAAELTAVPDERVLEIYNSLRPYRSTKEELINIAIELESKYNAKLNGALVRHAAEVYDKKGRLKEE
ncbi:diol dehydratase small subunit [uncultured Clostridium sp.]|uniref:diol dehydratase small subunit n=1 Tax=uncultured Clostridium sp. TaxID=59620 RepID=UPI0028E39275|nr:diol dehydratase small subunit [uncultured Clostridium sp.]